MDTKANSGEMHFYRGQIVQNMYKKSDMLRIRILPDMVGANKEDLPLFPMFNPTMVIKGVSEEDTKDASMATQVWVLATDDFTTGYVVAEANQQYPTTSISTVDPYGFSTLYTHASRMKLNTNSLNYNEIRVMFYNSRFKDLYTVEGIETKNGVATADYIDAVNVRTGERWWMNSSGTAIAFMQSKIVLRVGSPDSDPSVIDMDTSHIRIESDNISIHGRKHTSLGRHGMKVCGILGAPTAVDGSPIIGFPDMTM